MRPNDGVGFFRYSGLPFHSLRCLELDAFWNWMLFATFSKVGLLLYPLQSSTIPLSVSLCLSLSLSVSLSVSLCLCLSVCLSVCLSLSLSLRPNYDVIISITSCLFDLHVTVMPTFFHTRKAFGTATGEYNIFIDCRFLALKRALTSKIRK